TVTEAPVLYEGVGVFEKITSVSDLTDGYYVFAYNDKAMNNTLSSGKFGETPIVSSGGMVINPDLSIVWKIETIEGKKTIYNDAIEKFVNYSSSTNFTLVNNVENDNSKWDISDEPDYLLITNAEATNRGIIHRSTGVFGAYSTSNLAGNEYHALELYKWIESTIWDGMAWSNGEPNNSIITAIDGDLS